VYSTTNVELLIASLYLKGNASDSKNVKISGTDHQNRMLMRWINSLILINLDC